jgi:hypothetical protein
MASPPILTPANTTQFNRQVWLDTIEQPTFQGTELLNTIRRFPGRILNQANIRKYGRVLGTVLAQNAEGTGLTGSDPTGTPVTITPVGRYVKCEWSENERAQVDVNLSNGLAPLMERGLSETLDQAGLAAVTSLTQIMSQAAVDAPFWRQAVGRLMTNTNGEYGPGKGDAMIRAIFTTTQYPAVMGIDEFTHADVRGDGENPNVKGIFTKGGGINARFSTVVTQDANGWHCPLYVEDTFIAGWNAEIHSFEEQTELLFRIILSANMGVSVLHDARGIDMRFTASQL